MKKYTCPMHPEVTQGKPGRCPKCGMKLVLEGSESSHTNHSHHSEESNNYTPLIIIISLITLVTIVISLKDTRLGMYSFEKAMSYFMAGFFLVFSSFKLMDLKGFAEGYSTYDLLAKRVFNYGYVYPFIELGLGIAYILNPESFLLNVIAVLVMTFSGIGVAIKIAKKEKFQCACLGTFLKVPLTKVTLIEDFGMAAMALAMLFL